MKTSRPLAGLSKGRDASSPDRWILSASRICSSALASTARVA
jgi:hypothetical protein